MAAPGFVTTVPGLHVDDRFHYASPMLIADEVGVPVPDETEQVAFVFQREAEERIALEKALHREAHEAEHYGDGKLPAG